MARIWGRWRSASASGPGGEVGLHGRSSRPAVPRCRMRSMIPCFWAIASSIDLPLLSDPSETPVLISGA